MLRNIIDCLLFCRAKCGNGFDDETLEKLQVDLKPNMNKISKNPNQIPPWLSINRDLIPDFVVIDPKKSPVWEITVIYFIFSHSFSLLFLFNRELNFRDRNNIQQMEFQFAFLV